ncbi:PREDICTED: uncharacterized protein LOC104776570 [Camelina sativa]|uniref:Uncharacterized protein LOC104776570 n=1 Tax=Camelina sativa TaxID=90675 RepID=A0ABM0YCK3_CAMSA|nr:PREDICTED: uncharacterized protein LOC104776570 [Camelina sativa]
MAATASSEASEGPVMGLVNKRLRALRKKLNRITQMEESVSQGKTLNKEQEEVLRSKPAVVVLIEELEKLRAPLSAAVSEEISLATTKNHRDSSDPTTASEQKEIEVAEPPQSGDDGVKLEDLVNLLYFGSLFDVKSQNEFTSIMLTRSHERGCCLSYDFVSDDATDLLGDRDLDSISQLWSLMVSRPVDSRLSHKNALERCVEHAKLWLANSEQPIESNCNISYAALREKLKKIMASDYFTTTPEMKAPVEVAAAAGNYTSYQVPVDIEAPAGHYQQQDEDAFNNKEQESVVNDQSLQDEHQKVESVTEGEVVHGQQEQAFTQVEGKNGKRDYVPRGSYQNQRGRRGGRRGGGGYQNGRGGRGGGGGYQNGGRYESYDQSGGNGYQRNYYNNRGGRGRNGGGGNGNYNHQDANVSAAS